MLVLTPRLKPKLDSLDAINFFHYFNQFVLMIWCLNHVKSQFWLLTRYLNCWPLKDLTSTHRHMGSQLVWGVFGGVFWRGVFGGSIFGGLLHPQLRNRFTPIRHGTYNCHIWMWKIKTLEIWKSLLDVGHRREWIHGTLLVRLWTPLWWGSQRIATQLIPWLISTSLLGDEVRWCYDFLNLNNPTLLLLSSTE